jgi:hypothetical protein
MNISLFINKESSVAHPHFVDNLASFLRDELQSPVTPKDELPLWSPASFDGGGKEVSNVVSVSALCFDVDKVPTPTFTSLKAALEAHKLSGIITSSYYHQKVKPGFESDGAVDRWRVILPCRPLSVDEHRKLWRHVAGLLPSVGPESSNPNRGWFVPVRGCVFEVIPGTNDFDALLATASEVPRLPVLGGKSEVLFDEGLRTDLEPKADCVGRELAKVPKGSRHFAAMALAGALFDLVGMPHTAIPEFVFEASRVAGFAKLDTKRRAARDTVVNRLSGGAVTAFRTLRELCPRASEKLNEVFPIIPPPCKSMPEDGQLKRRKHSPNYAPTLTSYLPAQSGKLAPLSMNDVVNQLVLGEDWGGVFSYDVFADKLICTDPPVPLRASDGNGLRDSDVTSLRCWFAYKGFKVSHEDCYKAIENAAQQFEFHSVKEYLEELPPGTHGTIRKYCEEVMKLSTELEKDFVEKSLVAAVRRIYRPGCKCDTMLVLYSIRQGRFKSSWIEAMFQPWYRAQMPSLEGRDASHALEGYWGIEFEELDRVMATHKDTSIKAFLSRRTEAYRQFGTGQKIERPRSCIFVGTTNEPDILKDPSGARRWLPVEIREDIDIHATRKLRDALWANAYLLAFDRTFEHWFEDAEVLEDHQKKFESVSEWHETILQYCAGKDFVKNAQEVWQARIGSSEPGSLDRFDNRKATRINQSLRRLARPSTRKVSGRTEHMWILEPWVRELQPSEAELRLRKFDK